MVTLHLPHVTKVLQAAAPALLFACTSAIHATAATFIPLGFLDGAMSSDARGISADGSVVVGTSGIEAFRWTKPTGMVGLGDLPGGGFESHAFGVSADGAIVVGTSEVAPGGTPNGQREAFRWTEPTGMVGLGDLSGGILESDAHAASADGSVIVGRGTPDFGVIEAFRWTETGGMVGLGDLPTAQFSSQAFDVSADGSVVVGRSASTTGGAFRWTPSGGMVELGDLPGGGVNSQALAVSADGAVVVGQSDSAVGPEAFRWTETGGMVGLGSLPAGTTESIAYDVSADGSVVVGESGFGRTAFIWTPIGGMQDLRKVLLAAGVTEVADWELDAAYGVSADGRAIVGIGTNPNRLAEAWLAVIPEPSSMSLLAAGALLLGATAQRRQRGQAAAAVTSRCGRWGRFGLFAALSAFHVAAPADAQVVTFQFAGTIDESDSNLIHVGDPFFGMFAYDLVNGGDFDGDPTRSHFIKILGDPSIQMAFTAGSQTVDRAAVVTWITENRAMDRFMYTARTSLGIGDLTLGTISLVDPTGTVFDTDHSPATLDLADFAEHRFEGRLDPDDEIHHFSGPIELLERIAVTPLPGDHNGDGNVDAADYVVWRKDPNSFGGDPAGYDVWRANFGQTVGSGASSAFRLPFSAFAPAVPEPAAFVLASLGVAGVCAITRRNNFVPCDVFCHGFARRFCTTPSRWRTFTTMMDCCCSQGSVRPRLPTLRLLRQY